MTQNTLITSLGKLVIQANALARLLDRWPVGWMKVKVALRIAYSITNWNQPIKTAFFLTKSGHFAKKLPIIFSSL